MNPRRTFLSTLGLSAVLGAAIATSALAAPGPEKAKAKIGQPAPEFTLKDADGKSYTLSDYKGKIVVLQWISPQCPVCRRCTGTGVVQRMVKELKAIDPDYVHLAINSSHPSSRAFVEPAVNAAYLKKHEIAAPALDDREGTVGHLYGARTTPHLFVIDSEGVLRYSGAIDDDRQGAKGDAATNYVVNAAKQIVAGETVAPDTTKPYGCGVKYKR